MTQENKELLLKDLCARLPYEVKVHIKGEYKTPRKIYTVYKEDKTITYFKGLDCFEEDIENIKLYLRSMSSMTEEEFRELHSICPHSTFNKTNVSDWIIGINGSDYGRISRIDEISKLIDWLNAHHFDYHDLIPMGLALEALEGMYKID